MAQASKPSAPPYIASYVSYVDKSQWPSMRVVRFPGLSNILLLQGPRRPGSGSVLETYMRHEHDAYRKRDCDMLGAGMPKEPQLHPMEVVAGSGSWSRSWSRFGPCESRWALARATLQPNTKVQMQEATLQPILHWLLGNNILSYAHAQYGVCSCSVWCCSVWCCFFRLP